MRFNIVTIFPEMIRSYIGCSILKRAISRGLISINIHNLRDYAADKHQSVDDYPYGGGAGMVMKPEPFFNIIDDRWPIAKERRVILLSPQGRLFSQDYARELSAEKREVILLCGRYEAVDERVANCLADDEISCGDYILTGGELPALVIIDAVARLLPGVLGDDKSSEEESFSWGLLDYPHYTRPENFKGMIVPEILLSGNHNEIARWRKKEALRLTLEKRPDLIEKYALSDEEKKILLKIKEESR